MMKIPEMVATSENSKTALYLSDGRVNPSFGLTGEAPDTVAIVELMNDIFDGKKFGLISMKKLNLTLYLLLQK